MNMLDSYLEGLWIAVNVVILVVAVLGTFAIGGIVCLCAIDAIKCMWRKVTRR